MSLKRIMSAHALLLGTWMGACGPAELEAPSAPLASTEQELYPAGSKIWRTLNIPVCWEQPALSSATLQAAVRDAVTQTWSAATDVNFVGWGGCASNSAGIRIFVNDEGPHTTALGRELDGDIAGMVLNFTFQNWSPVCASSVDFCVRAIAVHEFGHALGFAHEQNRSDTPATCLDSPQGTNGDTFVGQWDSTSVMNYCAPEWTNNGVLSSGDIDGARLYYGGPGFKGTKRDVVDWGNGKLYFFNGMQYTRFDTGTMRVDSFYPRPVASNWAGWPASWSSGMDAAVNWGNGKAYFFNGSQYLRYDIAADHVDAGYPLPIASNWTGWPASWTGVDAAVDWGNGKAYFFRGSEYLKMTIATKTVDAGYPKPISGNWPGLWTSGIEFVTTLSNGKAYFFKGSQYIRYDMALDMADPGSPSVIAGSWPGVPF